MRVRSLIVLVFAMAALIVAGIAVAQIKRPYHEGSVWDVTYVRVKPGMDSAYMNYLATDWKKEHEAMKKEGLILSYKVISSEPHNAGDFNLMLMTEYKDLATMEGGMDKQDNLYQTVTGNDQKQMEGYKQRLEIREVLGDRLSREVILEPK